MPVKPIPDGYRTVTPYIVADGAANVIEFLKKAFDAEEIKCSRAPDGKVLCAEMRIGDSMVMLTDPGAEWKPMPGSFYLYVKDTDAAYRKAMAAGGASLMEPADQFYGDRNAGVKDPTGNLWWLATHIEDVPPAELARRAEEMIKQRAQGG
jgi:PhnB protein